MKDFINEYKGIIGTIIGTLFGFTLGSIKEYFKNRGKMYYDFSDFKTEYSGVEPTLGQYTYDENIDLLNDIYGFRCSFNLKITNLSSQTKILKDIKVNFIINNNELEGIPYIFSSKIVGGVSKIKSITLLDLKPYETQEIDLKVSINKDNINEELEFKNVYFKAKNIKGKDIKVKII